MAKADLKSLYPHDWPLLGMQWRNQYFVDKCLPFGLRSSPYLFNLVADALQWCHYGVADSFHYLDDFFFAGPPHSDDCSWAITSLCLQLGVPLKQEKLVLPSTSMTFLGILLDSASQIASIPQDKLEALLTSLRTHLKFYKDGTTVTKRSLLSLIGKLSFATKVIPAGRIVLRRLLDTAHSTPHPPSDSALDITWWLKFASNCSIFPGTLMVSFPRHVPLHGRVVRDRIRGLLERPLVTRQMGRGPQHTVERTLCNREVWGTSGRTNASYSIATTWPLSSLACRNPQS